MIPVTLHPEPADFDKKVRQKGHAWLNSKQIPLTSAPPKSSDLPAYWSHSNRDLWSSYSGTCAYLAIYFEWITGASSTDHFVAKSLHAGDAYEWSNYRLSCLGANRRKGVHTVLDPIGLPAETFFLNLSTGRIKVNPGLATAEKIKARNTIRRLKLNDPDVKDVRVSHFDQYREHGHEATLKRLSPFVWYEARRQQLL